MLTSVAKLLVVGTLVPGVSTILGVSAVTETPSPKTFKHSHKYPQLGLSLEIAIINYNVFNRGQ